METIKTLLSNEYFMLCVMAAVIFGLTQLFKLPIKAATSHIKNEKKRGIVNLVIVLIPFALGLLSEWLWYWLYHKYGVGMQVEFTGINGLQYGMASLTVYGVVEKLFKKNGIEIKLDNPLDTDEGKAVQELVQQVQEDGKIDNQDISAVDQFWKTISKDKDKKKK